MPHIKLHGLVPHATRKNTQGPRHDLVRCGPVSCIVSDETGDHDFASLPQEAIAEWALAHNEILLAYCAQTAVLPMAVGAVFSDATALRRAIDSNLTSYLSALEGLRA